VRRTKTLRKDMRSILADGAAFSVMVGIGETYLPAFILAIGLGEVAAGLITTLPLLAGACLQLSSPWGVRLLGSNRSWVAICATAQALSFLPLCTAAYLGRIPLWAAFAVASVYWGAGLGAGPAWNTWVGTIIPAHFRARYFATRTRVSQLGVLFGFIAGGVVLQYASDDKKLLAFGGLFLVGCICRCTSAFFLRRTSEPVPPDENHRHVSVLEFLRRFRHGREGRLLIYLLSVQAAAMVAGPYFTPYMLKVLKFPYGEYVILIGVAFATKVVALPHCGRLAHHFGARRLLWLGGVGIVPVAGLWLVSTNFYWLVFVQILAGLTWAGYELAMFLLFFETIDAAERTSVLTTFNLGNAMATVAGSLLGGGLLAWFGKSPEMYLILFFLSSLARFLTLGLLFRVPEYKLDAQPLATRTIGVRAADVSLDQPILPSIADDKQAEKKP